MFNFIPLLGAQSDSSASQSLLILDGGIKVLIDVGWDELFDAEKLRNLEKHVSSLSIVLLTHPTIDHIGAYAHCCKHIPLFSKIPVYATTPVINLGRSLVADIYGSSPLASSIIPSSSISSSLLALPQDGTSNLLLQPPSSQQITSYFNQINPLNYNQPYQPNPSSFSPPLEDLTVTAYRAGHTPGGTIWHIQHKLESIVYAADWNQAQENLLSGAAWLTRAGGGAEIIEPLRRPTTLICSSKGVGSTETLPRQKRDEILVGLIRDTVGQGGKVLIPTDTSARVLELAFILNNAWRENVEGPHADIYKGTKIYMANKTSSSTVRQLPSMSEWMSEAIIRDTEAAMDPDRGDEEVPSLLDWTFIRQIERKSQVEKALSRTRPCVILASDSALQWGFSRQALEELAADPRNLVVLTDNISAAGAGGTSPARQLADCWRARQSEATIRGGAKVVDTNGVTIQLQDANLSALSSEENVVYQQYVTRQQQLHSSLQDDDTTNDAVMTEVQDLDSSESEDEDDEPEHQGRVLNPTALMTQSNKGKTDLSDAELGINVLIRSSNIHDVDLRNKRGKQKVFPFVTHQLRYDEFGENIKPEDFLRAEERDDFGEADTKDGIGHETRAVGQKRKWNEEAPKPKKSHKDSVPKKAKVEREPDDIDALIARATGEDAPDEESDSDSDYEPEDVADEGPRKVTFSTRSMALQIRIANIDFSALHEKRDLQMLIPLIRPRKLILIAGGASETNTLADECRQLLSSEGNPADIYTPLVGEMIDASVDTNAWTLKLSRQLVRKLTWQNVKGVKIAPLTGLLNPEPAEEPVDQDDEQQRKKLKLVKEANGESDTLSAPTLDLLSTQFTAMGVSHQRATQPVHVGDVQLASLRRLTQASGHTAEFRGEGTLLIDSTVIVRKSVNGEVKIEAGTGGFIQGSFFAIRKLIYEALAGMGGT